MAEEPIKTPEQEAKLRKYRRRLTEAQDCLGDWHTRAEQWERYRAGKQWDDQDLKRNKDMQRPSLTFNQIHKIITSITGKEIMNRFQIRYRPRDFSDQIGADAITEQVRYHRQLSGAKYEESQAFHDCAVTGIGCTEIFVDQDDDPNGVISVLRVPRHELYWDPMARRKNLLDAKYVLRGKWLSTDEFQSVFNIDPESISESEEFNANVEAIRDTTDSWMYAAGNSKSFRKSTDEVLVVDYQYSKYEDAIVFQRPDGLMDFAWPDKAPQLFETMTQMAAQAGMQWTPTPTTAKRPRYYRCFYAGDRELKSEVLPTRGFSYNFMTGFEDSESETNRGQLFHGLVDIITGPQDFVNKILSQVAHVMSTNPKGGLIAGPGVFENDKDVEKKWAQPGFYLKANMRNFQDSMLVVKAEGLNQSWFQLLSIMEAMVPGLVGISQYDLGNPGDLRRVSGQALSQVQQNQSNMFGPMFDSLGLYRAKLGERYIEMLRAYMPDGQLVRVHAAFGQEVPLQVTRDHIFARYDVVVDEAPDQQTSQLETWQTLTEQGALTMLLQPGPMGLPLLPPTMLPELMPVLSSDTRMKWHEYLNMYMAVLTGGGGQPPPGEEQQPQQ